MKRNKNKKGFTLVELVIVSTIMVMVMGAILNFVQPINRFYQRTQYNSDANDVGNLLMDKVEAELRYATNVTVLEGYVGVPKMQGGYLVKDDGSRTSTSSYTNVIIIDNNSVRGSQLEDFDPNDTRSHRKGATGCILTAPIDDTGIDFDAVRILGGEGLYNDMQCEFTGRMNSTDARNKCVQIGMSLSRPNGMQAGNYKFDKTIFNQTRDLELVNINLADATSRGMKADYYSDVDDDAEPIKYTDYPNALGGSSRPGIDAIYNSGEPYTFIFFTRVTVTNTETTNATIRLFAEKGSTMVLDTKTIPIGQNIPQGYVDAWNALGEANAGAPVIAGGYSHYRTFIGISSDAHGALEDYATTTPVTESMDFYCNYQVFDDPVTPIGTVTFTDMYDIYGNLVEYSSGGEVFTSITLYEDVENVINFNEPGYGAPFRDFLGWCSAVYDDGTPAGSWWVPGTEMTSSADYYAAYELPTTLNFVHDDGVTPISPDSSFEFKHNASGSDVLTSSLYLNNVLAYLSVDADHLLFWDVYDSSDTFVGELSTIMTYDYAYGFPDDDYTIVGRIEEKPDGTSLEVSSYSKNAWWDGGSEGYMDVTIKNTGVEANSEWRELVITFDTASLTNLGVYGDLQYADGNGHFGGAYISGNQIIVEFDNPIPPGVSRSLTLQFSHSAGGRFNDIHITNIEVI